MLKTNTVTIVRDEPTPPVVTAVTITLTVEQAKYLNLMFYKFLRAGTNNRWLGNIYHQLHYVGLTKSLNEFDYDPCEVPCYQVI